MRYARGDLPESTWAVIDKYEMGLYSGDKSAYEVIGKHQKAWWKAYGKSTLLWIGSLIATGVVGTWVARSFRDTPYAGLAQALLGCALVGVIVWGVLALVGNRRLMTSEELEAILPALDASGTQRAYLGALVSLDSHPSIPAEVKAETRKALRELVDEEASLLEMRQSFASTVEGSGPGALEAERSVLAERIARTSDPEAADALKESLRVLEERIEGHARVSPRLERIDAQLEVIGQTLRSAQEAIVRSRQAPATVARDLDALRSRLYEARAYAKSVEEAVSELNA